MTILGIACLAAAFFGAYEWVCYRNPLRVAPVFTFEARSKPEPHIHLTRRAESVELFDWEEGE